MTINTPKVSIVTLLGNRNEFIPLLKFCVQYQTYSKEHIEWIILDDGKEDRSELFDLEFANYVKIFKQLNIGRKRQIACDIACGEFIIFLMTTTFIFLIGLKNLLKGYKELDHAL